MKTIKLTRPADQALFTVGHRITLPCWLIRTWRRLTRTGGMTIVDIDREHGTITVEMDKR